MLSEGIHVLTSSTPSSGAIIDAVVQIHAGCILYDNTMASFMPPLCFEDIRRNWIQWLAEVDNSRRLILVRVSRRADRSSGHNIDSLPFQQEVRGIMENDSQTTVELGLQQYETVEIAGVVSLTLPHSETGPFRATVQRLLVSSYHRRKGVASQLMHELESRAKDLNRWSLMLDTTVGTPAEHIYPKLGYERLGVVRQYGLSPRDRTLLDEVYFVKDLREQRGDHHGWLRNE